MANAIKQKITGFSVNTNKQEETETVIASQESEKKEPELKIIPPAEPEFDVMHENIQRDELLDGCTYKITPPDHVSPHSLYVTINNKVLNEGTPNQSVNPYEIFINSKNMEHFQWILGLTRVISAIFRKGGDVEFLVDELMEVFDPKGGYHKRGGVYMPSLVADIGRVIKEHLKSINVIKAPVMDKHMQEYIEKKKAELTGKTQKPSVKTDSLEPVAKKDIYKNATFCNKCKTTSVVNQGGCVVCLECGDSHCL